MIKAGTVTLNVKDLNASISFYESLGMTMKERWGEHYAELETEGLKLGLHPAKESNVTVGSGNASIGFTTDQFDEVKALLEKLSVKYFERNEEGGQFIHFKDPDGTYLYFIKPKW
jgi:catechol 2,3-dioxygenase-like lactoylglutathione lyase family enzyme